MTPKPQKQPRRLSDLYIWCMCSDSWVVGVIDCGAAVQTADDLRMRGAPPASREGLKACSRVGCLAVDDPVAGWLSLLPLLRCCL